MIQVFGNQKAARLFAAVHFGVITIQYDYDDVLKRILRQYVVKY